jgi:hypothetical protein
MRGTTRNQNGPCQRQASGDPFLITRVLRPPWGTITRGLGTVCGLEAGFETGPGWNFGKVFQVVKLVLEQARYAAADNKQKMGCKWLKQS